MAVPMFKPLVLALFLAAMTIGTASAETADTHFSDGFGDDFGGAYFTATAPAALDETFDDIAIARWAEEMLGSIEPAAGDDPFADTPDDLPAALPDTERLPLPEETLLP